MNLIFANSNFREGMGKVSTTLQTGHPRTCKTAMVLIVFRVCTIQTLSKDTEFFFKITETTDLVLTL